MVYPTCPLLLLLPPLVLSVLFVTLIPSINALFGINVGRMQSSGVRGRLLCKGQPASNVLLKLYDDDRGLDTDDMLARGRSDLNGSFELIGSTHAFPTIEPKLNIYHDCDDHLPCQRKVVIRLPDSYAYNGTIPTELYHAGQLELGGKFEGETRDCIH